MTYSPRRRGLSRVRKCADVVANADAGARSPMRTSPLTSRLFPWVFALPNCVLYARVSTDEQAERGLSLTAQIEACERHAERESWPVLARCQDEGVSAGKPLDKRPGLVAAIAELGRDDVLLVAKRDRIFRADPFECAVIERAVRTRGARIVSAAGEGTADDSPASVLMRRLLDAFAEYERLLIAMRTRAVLTSKRARNERTGEIPYGKRLAADGKTLETDALEVSVIGLMRSLRECGLTLRQIAAWLDADEVPTKHGGRWSHSTIAEILRRCPESKAP